MDSQDLDIRNYTFSTQEGTSKNTQLLISPRFPLDARGRSDSSISDLSSDLDIPNERDFISQPHAFIPVIFSLRTQIPTNLIRFNTWFDRKHFQKSEYFQNEETILAPISSSYSTLLTENHTAEDTEETYDMEQTVFDLDSVLQDPIYLSTLSTAEMCLNDILRFYNLIKGWKVVEDRDGIKTEKYSIGNKDQVVKVKSQISCSSANLLDFIKDVKNTLKWDNSCLEGYDLRSFPEDLKIIYIRYKQPKPIEDRDFIMTTKPYLLENNLRVLVGKSVDLIQYNGLNNKAVRANVIISGFLIEDRGSKACEMTYLAQVDPKGNIPRWLAIKVTKYHTNKIKALRNHFRISNRYNKLKTIS